MNSEVMMIGTVTDKLGHRAVFASQNYPDTLRYLWAVLNDYEVSQISRLMESMHHLSTVI